jgi:FixJ family two-component response regulator
MPRPESALVIDEDPYAIALERELLESLGVTSIWEASTSEEGLALYRQHQPQVVVCDATMPVPSGQDLVSELLELDPLAAVIVVTARGDVRTVQAMHERGAVACILKQVPRQQMLTLLDEALDVAGEPAEDEPPEDERA